MAELCPSLHLNALSLSIRFLRFMHGDANNTHHQGQTEETSGSSDTLDSQGIWLLDGALWREELPFVWWH